MNIYQQSPEHTPELFYMPRGTGEFRDIYDEQDNIVGQEEIIAYDVPVRRTVDPVARTITLERKSKAGVQKLVVDATKQMPIALWNDGVLIAEQAVKIETSSDNGITWETPTTIDKIIDVNDDGIFDALVSLGGSSYLHVDCSWNGFLANPDKQTFTAVADGKLVRIKWIVLVHDPEFTFNYEDYQGNVAYSYDGTIGLMEVTFEPDGVLGELIVDPYLSVDDNTTYYSVFCDGFVFRVNNGINTDDSCEIWDSTDTTQYAWLFLGLRPSGYSQSYHGRSSPTAVLMESNSERVVISQVGNLADFSNVALDKSDSFNVTYYIYKDRIFTDVEWVLNSSLTLTSIVDWDKLFQLYYTTSGDTSASGIYENSGSESTGLVDVTSAFKNYVGNSSAELTMQSICINPAVQAVTSTSSHHTSPWHNETLTAGTYKGQCIFILDTAGTYDIGATPDRLDLGNQYKDLTLPLTQGRGTAVTDLNIPASIDDGATDYGFASDGAWHFEADSNYDLEIPWDRTRINPNIVIHNWPVMSGLDTAIPDEHLIISWDCESLTSGTVSAVANGSTNYDFNSDGKRGKCWTQNVNDSEIYLPSSTIPIDAATISFDMKVNSASVASSYVMAIGNFRDQLALRFDSFATNLQFWSEIGDTGFGSRFNSTVFADDDWHRYTIAFHRNAGVSVITHFMIDGSVIGVRVQSNDWSSNMVSAGVWANNLFFGSDTNGNNNAATISIDNVQVYNSSILPYGAYFTGNSQVNTARAHGDVLTHWECSSSTLDIFNETDTSTVNITGTSYVTGVDGTASSAIEFDEASGTDKAYITAVDGNAIDLDKGSIGFWYKYTGTSAGAHLSLFRFGTTYSHFFSSIKYTSGSVIYWYLNQSNAPNAEFDVGVDLMDGNWHYLKYRWDWTLSTPIAAISVDGRPEVNDGAATMGATKPTVTDTEFYIGCHSSTSLHCEGIMDRFTITNNPNTPQIPTVGYKPMWMPTVQNKTLGTDYQQICLPDMSVLITDKTTVTSADTSYITDIHPDKGKWVRDLNTPASVGRDGLASDGAYHSEVDSITEPQLQFTSDIARSNMSLATHPNENWGIKTVNDAGTDYDEHLVFYDDMDSVANPHTPVVGSSVSVGGTVTTEPALRGDGVLFDAAGDNFAVSYADMPTNQGTLIFLVIGKQNMANHDWFFSHSSSSTYGKELRLEANSTYSMVLSIGGTSIFNATIDSSIRIVANKTFLFHIAWDSDSNFLYFKINDIVLSNGSVAAFTAPSWGTDNFYIGSNYSSTQFCRHVIDDFKIYNTRILPFGAYYTGIGSDGTSSATRLLPNPAVAHSDVTFYWNCSEVPTTTYATGTGGVTPQIGSVSIWASHDSYDMSLATGVYGNCLDQTARATWINPVLNNADCKTVLPAGRGSISLYMKRGASLSSSTMTIVAANNTATTNNIRVWHNDSNDYLYLYVYGPSGTVLYSNSGGSNSPFADNNWHHVLIQYDNVAGTAKLIIDGVVYINGTTTPWSDIVWGGELSFSHYAYSFGYIDEIYITNNPNTPPLWTAGYKPICLPVVSVS